MTERMRFSASRMDTWMTCPLQAKFQYEIKLPRLQNAAASFGSCIHHALDFFNRTRDLDGAIELFIDVWENPEKLGVEPQEWPKRTSYGSYRQRGIDVLRAYNDSLKWAGRKVIATEHKFLVPFGEFELSGFIDLVEMRKSKTGKEELRVVDYKTNKKQPYLDGLKLNIQFTTYVYAAMQPEFWFGTEETEPIPNAEMWWPVVKDLKPKGIWYHLETQKEIDTGPRDDKDFMRLYRACTEIRKAKELDVYVPNISGDSCVFCPYTEPCGVEVKAAEVDD